MALGKCRECGGRVATSARACPHCGAPGPTATGRTADAGSLNVHVHTADDSVAFPVVTLVFYLLLYPVGLILNLVGLFTGPREGCFLGLLLVFVGIPLLLVAVLVLLGTDAGQPFVDDFVDGLR